MMPYVMEFNRSYARADMAAVAGAMGLETEGMSEDERAGTAIGAVADLFASIGIPRTIADLGVRLRSTCSPAGRQHRPAPVRPGVGWLESTAPVDTWLARIPHQCRC
jgi:alcohol dehydrogenase YqhD (iron-dependent ADH family)